MQNLTPTISTTIAVMTAIWATGLATVPGERIALIILLLAVAAVVIDKRLRDVPQESTEKED